MLKKIPQSCKLLFWIPELGLLLALFLGCGDFALPAGGTVPRYRHSAGVGVAVGVNCWQSTNSYEVKCFWRCKWLLSSSGASCPGGGSAGERERLTGAAQRRSPGMLGPRSEQAALNNRSSWTMALMAGDSLISGSAAGL